MAKMFEQKKLAALASAVAGFGLLAAITGFSSANADIASSASVATVPQCTWVLNGVGDTIALTHPTTDGHTKYVGLDFQLSGSGSSTANIFVGPTGASNVGSDADNCSWYGATNSATSGASVVFGFAGSGTPAFTGQDAGSSGDTSMSFNLDNSSTNGAHSKSLALTITKGAACKDDNTGGSAADWTGLAASGGASALSSASTSALVAKIISSKTSTTSNCAWTTSLSTYVPGGISPANPSDTYNFTGPSIVTTLTSTGVTN